MARRGREATATVDAVIEQEAKRARASLEADAERGVRFVVLNAEDGGALEAAQRALRMQTGKPIPIVRMVWQAEEGLAEKRVGGFVPYNPEWANDTPIPNLSPEEKVRDMRWMLEKAASEGHKKLGLPADEHWMLRLYQAAVGLQTGKPIPKILIQWSGDAEDLEEAIALGLCAFERPSSPLLIPIPAPTPTPAPAPAPAGTARGWLYLGVFEEKGVRKEHKIGYTMRTPEQRMKEESSRGLTGNKGRVLWQEEIPFPAGMNDPERKAFAIRCETRLKQLTKALETAGPGQCSSLTFAMDGRP